MTGTSDTLRFNFLDKCGFVILDGQFYFYWLPRSQLFEEGLLHLNRANYQIAWIVRILQLILPKTAEAGGEVTVEQHIFLYQY